MPSASSPVTSLPGLAMIVNANTPYRTHLHLRIAREIPEVRLHSLFTHGVSNSPWMLQAPPELNAHTFGQGEASDAAAGNPRQEWAKAGRIIKYIEANNIRCVVLHGYNDLGRIRLFRYCHHEGIPVYLWGDSNIRSDHATGAKLFVKKLLLKYVFAHCTGFMSCGSLGKQYFAKYGADPSKVYYVPYEPDYELITHLPQEKIQAAAQQFGLSPSRRRIVYSGRLVDVKRVDLLIRAFNSVAATRPDWDLVIVGDGPLRNQLQSLVNSELKSRVLFLGFQDDQATISAVYRNSDVLCLPSDYEPWALVINEAAAAGLAIVSSDVVGASAELLEDGINGKFFKAGDLDSLTAALSFVTETSRTETLRKNSPAVLRRWRERGDPIQGLRRVLTDINVLAPG